MTKLIIVKFLKKERTKDSCISEHEQISHTLYPEDTVVIVDEKSEVKYIWPR